MDGNWFDPRSHAEPRGQRVLAVIRDRAPAPGKKSRYGREQNAIQWSLIIYSTHYETG
jgi:hypothetical protein